MASQIRLHRPALGRRFGLLLIAALAGSGCMALDVAGRGVPSAAYVRTITLETGPVDVTAGHGHHGPHAAPVRLAAPFDGWIHGFTWEVVGQDGESLSRDLLHHLKVGAPDRRELFSHQMLRIVGAGRETEVIDLPAQVGYRVRAGDPLLLTAMLHSPTGEDVPGVRVRLKLRYTPEGSWRDPRSVFPFFAQVTGPGTASSYDLPPGRSERATVLRPAIAGRILGLGGHVHRYGKELRLENATTGEVLWRTTPEIDASGAVVRVPYDIFLSSGGISVSVDDEYRFVATYENPTGETIVDGGMATLGGLFLPSGPWPAADTAHPIYVWDMTREMGTHGTVTEGHGGHE